jgi:spermidine synthase
MPPPDRPLPPALPAPLVSCDGRRRRLEFAPGEVQSEMLLAHPERLVLAYCRAIMCFALFVPRPRHIVMVGLGGGSLVKFCYRHFPHTRITVIELRADVIALRAQFAVPPDDARLRVVHADAVEAMALQQATADVIIVDGFDRTGLPAALGTARFYAHCRRALVDGGVLVTNSFSYDPHYGAMAARLALLFDARVCHFPRAAGNNRILFAVKAPLHPVIAPRALRVQRWVARAGGLGWLDRWLASAVVTWLARAKNVPKDNT